MLKDLSGFVLVYFFLFSCFVSCRPILRIICCGKEVGQNARACIYGWDSRRPVTPTGGVEPKERAKRERRA